MTNWCPCAVCPDPDPEDRTDWEKHKGLTAQGGGCDKMGAEGAARTASSQYMGRFGLERDARVSFVVES